MRVLAHRGANRLAPENTVAAMRQAIARGADGVELDVHRTADGELVVHHDAETAVGRIAHLTRQEIQAALPDVADLDAVLSVCRGCLVNVEMKDPDPRAVEALVAILAARSSPPDSSPPDDVLVSSFDLAAVDRVRELAPALPTGHLSFGVDPHSALALAHERGHHAVHPDVWTLAAIDVSAFVARAHDLGVRVHVWTVNDVDQVHQLRDAGVDAVITDDDELYRFGVRARPR